MKNASSNKLAEISIADSGISSQKRHENPEPKWVERNKYEEEFLKVKAKRINVLWEAAKVPHQNIRESIALVEGLSTIKSESVINQVTEVMPIARAFVESRVSEEIKVTTSYTFTPKKDARKEIFAKMIADMDKHVKRVTNYKANKHSLIRAKVIMGVSIKRKGYRIVNSWEKIPVAFNENNIPVSWELKKVPEYDDLFEEIISPLNFAPSPECSTLRDAEDCVLRYIISKEKFDVEYGNDPRWINTEYVVPGARFAFSDSGEYQFHSAVQNNGIYMEEYFHKILNEWVVIAGGVLISPVFRAKNFKGEEDTYGFPLPDLHRQLPFIVQYNSASFITEAMTRVFTDSADEEINKVIDNITGKETFWRKGDPLIIKELIALETGLTQAMFRNAKLASQLIIATERGYKFKSKKWKSGDQAVGMKGKYEVTSLGQTQQGQIQPLLDLLFQMKVLAIGLDPRNISQDNKTKSATEAAIIQETSMRRLNENIQFNIQEAELRDAEMTLKLIPQYYSTAEVVRLTGTEEAREVEKMYHDVTYIDQSITKEDGSQELKQIPVIGKRYRSIPSHMALKEVKNSKTGKYQLSQSKTGTHSFLIRPEYINILDVDIELTTENKLGEIQAVTKQQSTELVNLFLSLYQATVPTPDGSPSALSKDDLPPMKDIIKRLMVAYDLGVEWAQQKVINPDESSQQAKAMKEYMQNRKAIDTKSMNTLSSSPDVNANISTAVES